MSQECDISPSYPEVPGKWIFTKFGQVMLSRRTNQLWKIFGQSVREVKFPNFHIGNSRRRYNISVFQMFQHSQNLCYADPTLLPCKTWQTEVISSIIMVFRPATYQCFVNGYHVAQCTTNSSYCSTALRITLFLCHVFVTSSRLIRLRWPWVNMVWYSTG